MSPVLRRASTLYQDTTPTTQGKFIAHSSTKQLRSNSTRDRIPLPSEPISPLVATIVLPDSTQYTNTELSCSEMTKRPAETALNKSTTPKKPKKNKKTPSPEAAPASADDEPTVFATTASIEQEVTPTDEDESESEEVAIPLKTKKGTKASALKNSKKAATTKKAAVPRAKAKKPPVADGFLNYTHNITIPPPDQRSEFWGAKPRSGDPRPSANQPSARESYGQTDPPMWERRGYRYKCGPRYTKHNHQCEPDNLDELPQDKDQVDLLAVPLMDMRLRNKNDFNSAKKEPMVYCYGKVPKDWNCKQSIKALNDRRYQAIDRITMDPPWSRIEREFLASLLRDNPDASIWELTELHNDRFMGGDDDDGDYREDTGFVNLGNFSTGRTVESVRYQYTSYKPSYDRGEPPAIVRWRGDPSPEAKARSESKRFENAFGPPSKELEKKHDELHGGEQDEDDDSPKKPDKKKPTKKSKKTEAVVEESDSEDAFGTPLTKRSRTDGALPFAGQPVLDEDDEDLLVLAGAYDGDESSSVVYSEDNAEQSDKTTEEDYDDAEAQMISAAIEESAAQGSLVEQTVVKKTTVIKSTDPEAPSTTVVELTDSTEVHHSPVHASRNVEIDEDYGDEEESV
jgi:hypothetical protein